MAKTMQQLFEERAGYLHNMRGVTDRAKADGNRDLTPAEVDEMLGWKKKFEEVNEEYSKTKRGQEAIDWLTQQEKNLDRPQNERRSTNTNPNGGMIQTPKRSIWTPMKEFDNRSHAVRHNNRIMTYSSVRGSDEYTRAFDNWLATGSKKAFAGAFDPSAYMAKSDSPMVGLEDKNYLQSDDDERGGYTVPSETFMEGLLKEVDDQTWIWKNSRVIIVRQAQNLGIRKLTQKMSAWAKGSELSSALTNLDTSLRFGKKSLTPSYFTGSARVSRDLIRTSTQDIESLVYSEFGRDLGYVIEREDISGDGVDGPLGVLTASTDGISTARDTTVGTTGTTYTVETLIDAKYKLKQQYRNRARWMFNRARIAELAAKRDNVGGAGTGQFLWQPAIRAGEPDTVLGLPVDENEFFPTATGSGTYFGILAVWEYYVHAMALDMEILRLVETRAATNEIEYVGRVKLDGMPILEEAFVRLKYA